MQNKIQEFLMAAGFHFMFGMCEMILLLPIALTLEMVGVPKVQVKPPGVTDTAKFVLPDIEGSWCPLMNLAKQLVTTFQAQF